MPYRLNIRNRIFLTYPLLGLLISALMIVFFIISFDILERQLMSNFLLQELDHFIEISSQNSAMTEQQSKHWQIYKVDSKHQHKNLSFLTNYAPGIYDIKFQGNMYDIGIAVRKNTRYYIFYNDQELESLEINLILVMVAASLLIFWAATAYGLWFSKRVLKPVISLADEIKSLDLTSPEKIDVQVYAKDEVGFLAAEFDNYVNRIKNLIEREREFTANASHELRTPLTIIKTVTEAMLLRQHLPEDIKPRMLRIERAVNEMTNRLEALLVLSRAPGKTPLVLVPIDLSVLLEQLLEDYQYLCPSSVEVIQHLMAKPVITASPAMLSIVLCNLIKNAFSNTAEGSITIEIDQHQLSITDTGKGISPHILKDVFKRGYKGKSSQGQGLGLSLVQRICDYYQWKLSIDSASQQGTTVYLQFGNFTNN